MFTSALCHSKEAKIIVFPWIEDVVSHVSVCHVYSVWYGFMVYQPLEIIQSQILFIHIIYDL